MGGMSAGLGLALRRAVRTTAHLLLVGIVAFVPVRLTMAGPMAFLGPEPDETVSQSVDPTAQRVERLNERFGCSASGLDEGVIPLHAVVVVRDRVRVTTFDHGWAVHQGELPGTLMSVCAR
jgi:hypothetical protein